MKNETIPPQADSCIVVFKDGTKAQVDLSKTTMKRLRRSGQKITIQGADKAKYLLDCSKIRKLI